MALTQATKESIWLQVLFFDLEARKHIPDISKIYIDNQGASELAKNAEFHARTKHIDIQYHFIREHVENGKITLDYCPTTEMTADICTKPLPQPVFTMHNLGPGLMDQSVPQLQETEFQEQNQEKGAPVRGGVVDHRRSPDHQSFHSTV